MSWIKWKSKKQIKKLINKSYQCKINRKFDNSEGQVIGTVIYEKKKVSSGKSRRNKSYILSVKQKNNPENSIEIRVNKRLYEAFKEGDEIKVDVRSGFLGYRWVGAIYHDK